jgi:WD40 repeat protein
MHKWVCRSVILACVWACFAAGCASPSQTVVPDNCPAPTPEWLRVEPVTSPTDQLSQTVMVYMGHMEAVTITAESGIFTSTNPEVNVTLLPNTVHHLEVVARVREIRDSQGCVYGGYTLHTSQDKNGARLVIQQGQLAPPAVPGAAITPGNVSQLKPWFTVAPDARSTEDFVFSADTELTGVGYADKITRWNLVSGQEAGRIGEGLEEAAALCVAASPDGALLATGGVAGDGGVRLWDRTTGEMRELGRHESYVISIAFSPSGTRLASGDTVNKVWVWEVASGQALTSFEGDVPDRFQAFHDLYWPDDETLLAAASDAIYWWDVTTGQLLERLARPEEVDFFVDASFSRDGDRLAFAAQDQAVYFWDRQAAGWTTWPAQAGTWLSHVEFSPDGQLLAAITFDCQLTLWGVDAQELLAGYPLGTAGCAAVRFSPDGRYLAAGGYESAIWLWGVP